MSEKLKESLSAIVDDEADEFELRRVLDEVHKSPELKTAWERYHIIGAVMRDEDTSIDGGLRDKVWAALDMAEVVGDAAPVDEADVIHAPPTRPLAGRIMGIAVAAVVAVAVAIGGLSGLDEPSTLAPQIATESTPDAGIALVASTTGEQATPSDLDRERTAAYMLYHAQQLGMNQPGFAAFVKMVTYQGQ